MRKPPTHRARHVHVARHITTATALLELPSALEHIAQAINRTNDKLDRLIAEVENATDAAAAAAIAAGADENTLTRYLANALPTVTVAQQARPPRPMR
jgi:uncharacterized protein (UPF0276 family)